MNAMDEKTRRLMLSNWATNMKSQTRRPVRPTVTVRLVPSRFAIDIALKGGAALLFSSATRALSRLNPAEAARWRGWKEAGEILSDEDPLLANVLTESGYAVPQDRDELGRFQQQYFAERHSQQTLMLTIAPTMACNLACGYCFQGLNKDLRKLDERVPDAIMELVKEQTGTMKALNVTWYGGEPLMAKKEIFALADRMIAHCDRHGIQYTSMIVTNGYFLTAEVARQLWVRRCSGAQVTIDGVEETHDKMRPMTSGRGSFKTIMENLGEVLDNTPLGISLRVNVGQRNVGECNDLLNDIDSRGFAKRGNFGLYFAPIDAATPESGTAYEESLTRKSYNEALSALGARARSMGLAVPVEAPRGIMGMCVAARDNGYVITHSGDVHKCWETAHDPRKRIGTIFDRDAFSASPNDTLWKEWSPFDSEICRGCKILPMCGGLCGHRYIYQGSGDDQALPCPEWKWNTAELLFARAVALGAATKDEWLEQEATVTAMQSGQRHSPESLRGAQNVLLDKVSRKRGETIDAEFLHHGDGRFFETHLTTPKQKLA